MIKPTPIVYLEKLGIFLKLEERNPTGSVKDRPVFFMIKKAIMEGKIEKKWIVEPTSGNTGIAMAMMGAKYGLKVKLIVPESISQRKIRLIEEFGAEVEKTPAELGMRGAVEKAKEYVEDGKAVMLDQFSNPNNVLSHELTTGPEILEQMNFEIDAFICGVGTGGTLMGVSKVLRRYFGDHVKIFAVEPAESAVLSGEKPGKHGIEGIGAGFVPPLFDPSLIDGIVKVSTEEASNMKDYISKKEGISVGFSTGANVAGALKIREMGFSRIVTVEPDSGLRYL